jgi:predicted nucleotidyltransferase
MRVAGVVAEFNPLHGGHVEHFRETKKISACEKIVCAMSGNFVQRGEPALCDKWRRTRMALLAGADVVVEIPVPYVVGGADFFARGSVGLLVATGVVDALCFGSECGDVSAIKKAAEILAAEPQEYKNILRENLSAGLSFAAARGDALRKIFANAPEGLFTKPNNTLAIEYCKALGILRSKIEIFTTHRKSGGPSATKIRAEIAAANSFEMPAFAKEILEEAREKKETALLNDFTEIFRYLLYTRDFNLGEGLENRFRKFCDFENISDFLDAAKTKRYTRTRLSRAVMQIILNISASDMNFFEKNGGVQYIRVLGFRRESTNLLSEITKKAALPVITHGAAIDNMLGPVRKFPTREYSANDERREFPDAIASAAAKMLAKDLEAGDIYRCATHARGGFRSERAAELVLL